MTSDRMWRRVQKHLGYTEAELEQFKSDPVNEDIISKSIDLQRKYIILEVIESQGCNSGYKVGDRFYFDGVGNLLTELCPPKVCGYSLNSALMLVYAANEMLFAGVDPNGMRFKRASCFDVGLDCGGWGRVVLELKVEDRKKKRK